MPSPRSRPTRPRVAARARRPVVEALEGRQLLAGGITEYPIAGLAPTFGSGPNQITAGPDGALWFTVTSGSIGRITTDGATTLFSIPTASSSPGGITAGPDGALWFTEGVSGKIGRITTDGVVTEFPVPGAGRTPGGITSGPDGALWFTEFLGNRIGRITTAGVVTEFDIPGPGRLPSGITAGPDGALWFTLDDGTQIGRITTAGDVTEFPIIPPGGLPGGITAGPDGALWFAQQGSNEVGRITTAGSVTRFPITSAPHLPVSVTITAGPDGALWFTETASGLIGRITTAGPVTEYALITALSDPVGITSGPDGALWLTEGDAARIGRLDPAIATPTRAQPPPIPPGVPPAGLGTLVQLSAAPTPAVAGRLVGISVILSTTGPDGLPRDVAPTGGVAFSIDGGPPIAVPLQPLGGFSLATLPVPGLTPGAHVVTASFPGSASLASGSSTLVIQAIAPPTVVGVRRLGFHAEPTRIVLSFSGGLDPATAGDLRNYRIVGPGGKALSIDSATYDPAANAVTLRPHARLDLHQLYELTVIGTAPHGVADTSGVLLDGAGDGQPGSDYVATLKASDLVLGAEVPGGPRRLAALRRTLARIEAYQSKQLARKQVAPKARAVARAHPAKATGVPSAGKH